MKVFRDRVTRKFLGSISWTLLVSHYRGLDCIQSTWLRNLCPLTLIVYLFSCPESPLFCSLNTRIAEPVTKCHKVGFFYNTRLFLPQVSDPWPFDLFFLYVTPLLFQMRTWSVIAILMRSCTMELSSSSRYAYLSLLIVFLSPGVQCLRWNLDSRSLSK